MTDVVSIKIERTEIVCVAEMLAKRNQIPFDGILYAAVASMYSGNTISIYPTTDIAGTHRTLRLSQDTYDRIVKLASKNNVSELSVINSLLLHSTKLSMDGKLREFYEMRISQNAKKISKSG